ncbi:alpha/beta hydrolase [Rhodococcus sp. NPDC055024]
MPLDPQARHFLELTAGTPPIDSCTPAENRAALAAALDMTGTVTDMYQVEDMKLGRLGRNVPIRVYRPLDARQLPVLVYFHGGGWYMGDLDIADTTARDIASASGVVVVSVDYRLAPENRFPAALDDALSVTCAVLSGDLDDVDHTRVAVGGDSAGGNLAAVVAQELRGEEGLRHQVLIYPATRTDVGATESSRLFAEGHFLTARDMQFYIDTYAGDADRSDPRLAPSVAKNLSGLPSATVITAEFDVLRDEGEDYARAMREAGVPVTLRRFEGQVHPFVYMAGVIDAAAEARLFIGEELKAVLE